LKTKTRAEQPKQTRHIHLKMSNPAHLPYEHYLVTLAKRVEAPDAEYMPPTFPFNLFDEAKFAEAEYGEDMKKNFAIEEGIHFLSTYRHKR
jgi:hypothetical protein